MKIKNSISLLVSFFFIVGCQTFSFKSERGSNEKSSSGELTKPISQDQTENEPSLPTAPINNEQPTKPTSSAPHLPKIGIILSPGGALTYAQIGILESLLQSRMPVDFIVGSEWGSLPAALIARSGMVQDSEWQAMKIPDDVIPTSGILKSSTEPNPASDLRESLDGIFTNQKIEAFKVPFACMSLDLSRRTYFFRNAGDVLDVLPTCMVAPPLFNTDRNTAAAFDLNLAIDYLNRKGIKFVVFINVLPKQRPATSANADSGSKILWTQWQIQAQELSKRASFVINLDPEDYTIESFDQRRALISKGKLVGQKAALELSRKIGY